MAPKSLRELSGKTKGSEDDDNSPERPESHQSSTPEVQKTPRDTLILQTERLCAAERARTQAVLERLGLSTQQDPLHLPQPPAASRTRPIQRWRTKPVTKLTPLNVETPRGAEMTPSQQGSPESQGGEVEQLHPGRDHRSSLSASVSSEDTFSSLDTHTPTELRAILLIRTPVEVSPPQTPWPASPPPTAALRRKIRSRLPVMKVNLSGADKEVSGGYKLQTARHQVEALQEALTRLRRNSVPPLPRPLVAPKRTRLTPAPPPKPAPPKKSRAHCGTSVDPKKSVRGQKTDLQTVDSQDQEDLQPLSHPEQSLSDCFKLLSSDDWMKKVHGLRCVRALAQHHPETLMVKLHEVCLAVMEEVLNLRSSVAAAAMDTVCCLCVHLQRDMDPEVETVGRALLLKIGQSKANVFIQQRANVALQALVNKCSPGRVLTALLNTGLSHLNVAVRTSFAQQLHLLADRLGAAAVLTGGRSFTQCFLTAANKMSVDAAAEVRLHGHAVLQKLSLHRDFMKLWQQTVENKDRRSLEKILENMVRV